MTDKRSKRERAGESMFLRQMGGGSGRRGSSWHPSAIRGVGQTPVLRRIWRSSREQWRRVALVGLAAWAVYSLILSPDGAVRMFRLQHEAQRIEQEIARLEATRDSLGGFLDAFDRGDAFAIEKVARERYGLVRENERVIHLPTASAAQAKKRLTIAETPR